MPQTETAAPAVKLDRRSQRSQRALRRALADELAAGEDIARVSVAALTDRAGLTRRTFYSHYRDIPDFVDQVEAGLLAEIRMRIQAIARTDLEHLYARINELEPDEVADRMKTGIFPAARGSFFDYYLSYVVAAETGVVQRWFENGLTESPETMARIMTVIAFVRPGDLYGQPIDINVPAYGMKLMGINFSQEEE